MATQVVKKDGTKVPFDAEKIKKAIAAAADQAGISEERKNEVVEQVTASAVQMAGAKEEITSVEIREKVLGELDQVEPSVSEAWRKYDQEKKAA
jgi:transcriptional regulator NrdR family protein